MFCLFCLTVILVLSYVFHIRIFPILDENNVQQTRDFHLFGVEKYCISDNYTKKYGGVLWHFCGDQQPFKVYLLYFTQVIYLYIQVLIQWRRTIVSSYYLTGIVYLRNLLIYNSCRWVIILRFVVISWNWPDRHTKEKC